MRGVRIKGGDKDQKATFKYFCLIKQQLPFFITPFGSTLNEIFFFSLPLMSHHHCAARWDRSDRWPCFRHAVSVALTSCSDLNGTSLCTNSCASQEVVSFRYTQKLWASQACLNSLPRQQPRKRPPEMPYRSMLRFGVVAYTPPIAVIISTP